MIVQVAIQFLPHGGAAAVQARLHHVRAEVQDVRGIFGGKLFQVAQQNHSAVDGRQFGDHPVDHGAQFGIQQDHLGVRRVVGRLRRWEQLVEGQFLRGREQALAALHQAGVLGDAEDPGAHPFGLAQLVDVLENLEQGLLRHLLGVLRPAAHQPTIVEDFGAEMVYEPLESIRLAGEHGARQFCLLGPVHALILTCRRRCPPGPAGGPS